jgi:glycosyltransferase involved in cell wall biosynthesis
VKVLALRADAGGCASYRIENPARVIREQFPEIDIRVAVNAEIEGTRDRESGLTTVREVKEDVDLIIVQRPLNEALGSLLGQARRQGIATIVEIDDDLSNVHPSNTAYEHVQPETNDVRNYTWLEKTARDADLLTCTTKDLGKYNERHAVLPNYVPESIFDIKRPDRDKPVVGWTGTLQTHPYDLDVTRGQVGRQVADAEADFFVVGDGKGVQMALKLRSTTKFRASGWVPLDDYYQTIADNIDIGITPLESSEFNTSKSWLKSLEYSALGIPSVFSGTEDYQKLHAYGIGKIAHDHNGFRYALRNWLNNPAQARADGVRYQEIVRENLTYEQHAADWVQAWERAIDIRKRALK